MEKIQLVLGGVHWKAENIRLKKFQMSLLRGIIFLGLQLVY